jgi:hypothetical protein
MTFKIYQKKEYNKEIHIVINVGGAYVIVDRIQWVQAYKNMINYTNLN